MWAVTNGHSGVVCALVDAGADLSKRKLDGKSASDVAALKGRKEVNIKLNVVNEKLKNELLISFVIGKPAYYY